MLYFLQAFVTGCPKYRILWWQNDLFRISPKNLFQISNDPVAITLVEWAVCNFGALKIYRIGIYLFNQLSLIFKRKQGRPGMRFFHQQFQFLRFCCVFACQVVYFCGIL